MIYKLFILVVFYSLLNCAQASQIDMDQEIFAYNQALLNVNTNSEVYRFNLSFVNTQGEGRVCLKQCTVGIPHYSVLINNIYISSFRVQTLDIDTQISAQLVEQWVESAFYDVNNYRIIETADSSIVVFISTDKFIEEHLRISTVKDDFLSDHKRVIKTLKESAPWAVEFINTIRTAQQLSCYRSDEASQILEYSPMFRFLDAINSIMGSDGKPFMKQLYRTVLDNIDCYDQMQWIDNVRLALKSTTS